MSAAAALRAGGNRVADDVAEPVHAPALRCCLDCGRHVVDARGLPPRPRYLGGLLAAAEVERAAEGAGALRLPGHPHLGRPGSPAGAA
jgi:hypothetical protein